MRLSDYARPYSRLWELAVAFDWAKRPETKESILERIYRAGAVEERERREYRQRSANILGVVQRAVDASFPWHVRLYRRLKRGTK